MKKARYVVLDCETGGKKHEESPITQIAMITIDNDYKEIDRYETFIKPYGDLKIYKEALDITGLTMSDINSGIDYKKAVKLIREYFKKAKGGNHASLKPVVVGHNPVFDTGFINHMFELAGDSLWKYINGNVADTMLLTKMLNPTISSLSLGVCCEEAGIKLSNAHSAMPDTVATKDLFVSYMMKMRSSGEVQVLNGEKQKRSRPKFQF